MANYSIQYQPKDVDNKITSIIVHHYFMVPNPWVVLTKVGSALNNACFSIACRFTSL